MLERVSKGYPSRRLVLRNETQHPFIIRHVGYRYAPPNLRIELFATASGLLGQSLHINTFLFGDVLGNQGYAKQHQAGGGEFYQQHDGDTIGGDVTGHVSKDECARRHGDQRHQRVSHHIYPGQAIGVVLQAERKDRNQSGENEETGAVLGNTIINFLENRVITKLFQYHIPQQESCDDKCHRGAQGGGKQCQQASGNRTKSNTRDNRPGHCPAA